MSKAMQLVGIILLGSFTLVIIYLMSDVRSTNELDYYLLQEVTEAAMYDSVDYSYYRDTGLLKVDRDMFLENFNRRFAQSVSNNRDYDIRIIDFNETPPKVSVEAKANTIASVKGETAVITSQVSGILETIYDDLVMSKGLYRETLVDTTPPTIEKVANGSSYVITMKDDIMLDEYCIAYLPKELNQFDESKITSLRCFRDIGGKTEETITRSFYSSNTSNEWIIVYDSNRNSSYIPLNNGAPFIKSYDYKDDTGTLKLVLYDDIKVSSYAIGIDDSNSSNLTWIDAGTNRREGGYMAASITITNFLRNKAIDGTHDYYIFAKDNTGLISNYQKITISKTNTGRSPSVRWSRNGNTLLATFSDEDGDLSKYRIESWCGYNSGLQSIAGYQTTVTVNIPSYSGTTSCAYSFTVWDRMGNQANSQGTINIIPNKVTLYNSETGYELKHGDGIMEHCYEDDNGNWQSCSAYLGQINADETWNKTYTANFTNYSKLTIKFKQYYWDSNGNGMMALHDIFGVDIGGNKTVLSHWDRRVTTDSQVLDNLTKYCGYTALNPDESGCSRNMNTGVVTAVIDVSNITGTQDLKFYLKADSFQVKMSAQIYSIVLE